MVTEVRLTAGDPAREIARWRSRASHVTARLAISGDLVAMDADRSGPLDVADVIYCRERPAPWLSRILDRYPGCAVAATGADRGCLVACRTVTIPFFNPLTTNDLGLYPLICAMFVHGWRAAGWPLAALDAHGLVVTAEHLDSVRGLIANSVTPTPFRLCYESRCRISSASGAPTSE